MLRFLRLLHFLHKREVKIERSKPSYNLHIPVIEDGKPSNSKNCLKSFLQLFAQFFKQLPKGTTCKKVIFE
jgi:hypothetical protein